jgi:hypothetical protein
MMTMAASLEDAMRWQIAGNEGFAYSILSTDVIRDLNRLLLIYENIMIKPLNIQFIGNRALEINKIITLGNYLPLNVGKRFNNAQKEEVYVSGSYFDINKTSLGRRMKGFIVIVCESTDDAKLIAELKQVRGVFVKEGNSITERVIFITDIAEECFDGKTYSSGDKSNRSPYSTRFDLLQPKNDKFSNDNTIERFTEGLNELKEMVNSVFKKIETSKRPEACKWTKS